MRDICAELPMSSGWQLLRNSAVLTRTVVQSMVDFRRRSRRANPHLSDFDRALWMHEWCGKAMRRLKISLQIVGTLPESGLVVSNHLSYLDIFAFGSAMPCVFVSKAEVRDWPVFGQLTTMAGTVYVDRQRRSDTRNANEGIKRALEQGLRVVIFPEGTSSDGSKVLPFYPSLFEPAVETDAPITAAHISYAIEDGNVGEDIAYWGEMTFFPHLLKLLSKRKLSATVTFSQDSRRFSERKLAAAEVRKEVLKLHSYSSSSATAAELR
ncbi:MAG TPA: lysophospholipid acyltransferase family protein [Terriglobales bacterium]|nr:lysophospholipid acyltransferase family protein [Terriglobales bacterium]